MNKKGFANIILVLVTVVLVGAAGYFLFMGQPTSSIPTSEQTTPTQVMPAPVTNQAPPPSPSKVDTSSWRTYQLAHPVFPNWKIKFPQTFRCPESHVYPCSKTSVLVAGVRIDENGKVILSENSGSASLTLCTEDFMNDVAIRATYCVVIETSDKWSSSDDFFSYIKSQMTNPENVAKQQKQNISILKVNDPIMINGSTVVKVEIKAESTSVDRYFVEKDLQNFLRISVVKHKLLESQQRATEIDAIIKSFEFVK